MEPSQEISTSALSQDRVKVSDLVRERSGVNRFHGDYRYEDLKTDGAISADWQAQPVTAGVSVQGSLHGSLLLDCARCLEPYTVPVDLQIDERYVFDSYV